MFGRWDDTKGEENIDFMPTILSRFDMIFIIKDEHDEHRDVVSFISFSTGNVYEYHDLLTLEMFNQISYLILFIIIV